MNDYMLKDDRDEKLAKLERKRQEWERVRARGKLHFILYDKMFVWGGTLFLLNLAWGLFRLADRPRRIPELIVLDASLICVLSLLFGIIEWHIQEGRFGNKSKYQDAIHEH